MRAEKLIRSKKVEIVPQSLYNFLLLSAGFRMAKPVVEVMFFRSAFGDHTYYHVCPACHVTLEREFMSYCDRCGQHLDWRGYRSAKIIFPGRH